MMDDTQKNEEIKILQINLGYRAAAHDALMSWLMLRNDQWIVCIQEPYFSKRGIPRLSSYYGVFWYEDRARLKRAIVIAPRRLNGYMVTQFSSADRIVVRFRELDISVVSVYCGVEKEMQDSMQGVFLEGDEKKKVICCLDSNAYHEWWGYENMGRRWKGKKRGRELIDMLEENDFHVCNVTPHPPTFIRDSSVQNSSHVDITIVSRAVFDNILAWKVTDETFGSDHHAISFVYSRSLQGLCSTQPKDKQAQIPWQKPPLKMQAIMRQVFSKKVVSMQWVERVEDVDEVIERHSEQVRGVLNQVFKTGRERKCRQVVYWWNDEVRKAHGKMRITRRRMRKYRYENLRQVFNECRQEFRKVVRQAKIDAWRKFTTDIRDPWERLIKIVKATASGKIQARTLSNLEGVFAGDMEETLHLLGKQFFPVPETKLKYHIDIETMVEQSLQEVQYGPRITVAELRKAAKEMTNGTAPGLDLITNNVLGMLLQEGRLEQKILKLYNMCLRHSYFPTAWKKAKIVLIPKPSPLPNSAKAFRPISLTPSYAKLFERIILARLLHYLYLSDKMTKNQHAYKKGSSTQTALHELLDVVQSALTKRRGGVCVIVFLDISGAFDCTWHYGILHKLLVYGVPLYLVAWLKDFLHGRRAIFNESGEQHEVELKQGCPQGGVLSPILWNVLFNEMLGLEIEKSADRTQCMKVIGYADDAAIVCKGNTVESITMAINLHLKKISEWATRNRVKFNQSKLAVLTISNKLIRPSPAVIYYNNVLVHEVQAYKYLGLMLDNKLNWTLHITETLRKLALTTASLRGLSQGNWGVSLDIYRILYHAIFVPIMMYGVALWGWKAVGKTICDKFDREIRKFGLMATRCQRSTSNVFIFAMLKTQSFSSIMRYEVLKVSVNQFYVLDSKRKQIYDNYQKKRKVREVPQSADHYYYMLRRGMTKEETEVEFDVVNEQYKLHPSKWAATRTVVQNKIQATIDGVDKKGWVIFTDASASSYGIGWGYVVYRHGFSQHINYGSLTKCSIFMAEAYAVLQAVKYVRSIQQVDCNEVLEIRSDAQGLVRALSKYVQTDFLLSTIQEEMRLAYLSGKNVLLRWVPSHNDILGNEIADKIAKNAVDSKRTTYMRVTKKDVDRCLKERQRKHKQQIWEDVASINIKNFLPDMNAVASFLKSSPSASLCQIVSGHTRLNDFVCNKLGLIKSALCECGEDNETVMHFLMDCSLYDAVRWEVWEDFRPDYDFMTSDWKKLNEYILKTGRLSRSVKENWGIMGEGNRE